MFELLKYHSPAALVVAVPRAAPSGIPSLLKSANISKATPEIPVSPGLWIPSPFVSFQTRLPISIGAASFKISKSPSPLAFANAPALSPRVELP